MSRSRCHAMRSNSTPSWSPHHPHQVKPWKQATFSQLIVLFHILTLPGNMLSCRFLILIHMLWLVCWYLKFYCLRQMIVTYQTVFTLDIKLIVFNSCFYFFTGSDYAFDWRLITHPKDYSGEMEGKHSTTLKLSKVQPSYSCIHALLKIKHAAGALLNV